MRPQAVRNTLHHLSDGDTMDLSDPLHAQPVDVVALPLWRVSYSC